MFWIGKEAVTQFIATLRTADAHQFRGAKALKSYLKYAQTKILDVPTPEEADPDSPFEDHVYEKLSDYGYQVHRQIGSGSFFIDMAVVGPEKPGRYLLGIECDGATYHSSKSARDRDRRRQVVLERLGWTLHRIWSTDWFRDPKTELEKVLVSIEKTKTNLSGGLKTAGTSIPAPPEIERSTQPTAKPIRELAKPYQMIRLEVNLTGHQLHEISATEMADWVERVVNAESPIHVDEIARRITTAAGLTRTGRRIRKAVETAIGFAVREGMIVRKGSFGWSPSMSICPIRDRSSSSLLLTISRMRFFGPCAGRMVSSTSSAPEGRKGSISHVASC